MTDCSSKFRDAGLGMDSPITRRDFLGATLLAAGEQLLQPLSPAALLAQQPGASLPGDNRDWNGYGGVGEYANSNGNTWEVLSAGHKLRDMAPGADIPGVVDSGEVYDCVVVGGGISGLAAAAIFLRQAKPGSRCLVLENHPIFGGEAKQNEFDVGGTSVVAHQGSAIYFVPYPRSFLADFYNSIGLREPRLSYQTWGKGPQMKIGRTPYDSAGMATGQYGFYFTQMFIGGDPIQPFGSWVIDPVGKKFAGAPVDKPTKAELLRWYSGEAEKNSQFTPPQYEGDPISRALDSVSLEDHYMQRFGLTRKFIRTFLSPDLGGGSGLGADALSAYCEYAADLLHPYEQEGEAVQMFPGGNTTIARLIVKALIPSALSGDATPEGVTRGSVDFAALDHPEAAARIRLRSTVLRVSHAGDPAKAASLNVIYEKDGRYYRVQTRSAIMAGGSWTSKHVISDLPEAQRAAYAQFFRSPCIMANVALRNWRFLAKLGITGCRWFGDKSGRWDIGNYFELRRMALVGNVPAQIDPDSPVVLTLKILFSYPGLSTQAQGQRGRAELLSTSFHEYETRIRDQLTDMFARAGFDAQRDIAGIVLNRWGHAYLSPQPGFFFGTGGQPAPRDVLRSAPFGRIAFANTDLAGIMDHRCSILEARRAVAQLFDSVLD